MTPRVCTRRIRATCLVVLGLATLAVGAYLTAVAAWERYLLRELQHTSPSRQWRAAFRLEGMRRPLRDAAEEWYMTRLHDGRAESIRLAAEGLRRLDSARGLIEALRVTVPLPARKVYDCPFGGIPESRPEEQFGYFVEVPAPGHSSRTRSLSGATLALSRLGPSHAGVVAEALRVENNERVRFQLAYALGEMGSADAAVLEALRSATLARLYGVRWIATESLRKLLFP